MSDDKSQNKPELSREAMRAIGAVINAELMAVFGCSASRVTVGIILDDGERELGFVMCKSKKQDRVKE